MLSIFSYVSGPSGPSVCPPWRIVWSSPLPIFNWVVCLPGVESCEFFIYFGDQTLDLGILGKYVFPYGWFSFHFNDVFFSHSASVNEWVKKLVYLHNGILRSRNKGAPTLCNDMDGTGEHYAKWNKPGSEREILYDLTCKSNLKDKTNKQANLIAFGIISNLDTI